MKDDTLHSLSWDPALAADNSGLPVARLGASLAYWLVAHSYFLPGLYLQRYSTLFGLSLALRRRSTLPKPLVYRLLNGTLDSTSYFEFDFAWKSLPSDTGRCSYLDVLSPWMLPLLLILRRKVSSATIVNPDSSALSTFRRLLDAADLGSRCETIGQPLERSALRPESFEVITSISGPAQVKDDSAFVTTIWRMLKAGGRLILTLPCARKAAGQSTRYGQRANAGTRAVYPRVYDPCLLRERIFSVLGEPHSTVVYGRTADSQSSEPAEKSLTLDCPPPREPVVMARDWCCFSRIEDLPAQGVVAMAFIKARAD